LRRSSAFALNNRRNVTNKDLAAVTLLVAQIFRGTPVHTCPSRKVSMILGAKSCIEKHAKHIYYNLRPNERGE